MNLPKLHHGATFLVYFTVTSTTMTSPSDFNIYIKDTYGNNAAKCEVGDTPVLDKLSIMVRSTYEFDIAKYYLIIADAKDDRILTSIEFDVVEHYEPFADNLLIVPEFDDIYLSGHITPGELYGVQPNPEMLLENDSGYESTVGNYIHTQLVPNSKWIVQHFMDKYPSVVIVDSAGTTVYGEISYVDRNIISLEFSYPFAGKAFIN